jgi:hypothetical protein
MQVQDLCAIFSEPEAEVGGAPDIAQRNCVCRDSLALQLFLQGSIFEEKYSDLVSLGWRILRKTPDDLADAGTFRLGALDNVNTADQVQFFLSQP